MGWQRKRERGWQAANGHLMRDSNRGRPVAPAPELHGAQNLLYLAWMAQKTASQSEESLLFSDWLAGPLLLELQREAERVDGHVGLY